MKVRYFIDENYDGDYICISDFMKFKQGKSASDDVIIKYEKEMINKWQIYHLKKNL